MTAAPGPPGTRRGAALDTAAAWLATRRRLVVLVVPLVGAGSFLLQLALSGRPQLAERWPSAASLLALLQALGRLPPLMLGANLVMALPLILGLRRAWNGRALAGLLLLALWSYLIEGLGVRTGWPYGRFRYQGGLEPMLLDTVPLALPLFWLPMILSARLLTEGLWRRRKGRRAAADSGARHAAVHPLNPVPIALLWPASALLLVLQDALLDPAAVGLGFWSYEAGGAFYGVPLSNYLGWCFSGLVAQGLLSWALTPAQLGAALPEGWSLDSLRAFLCFWGLIALGLGQALPCLVALLLAWLAQEASRGLEMLRSDPMGH